MFPLSELVPFFASFCYHSIGNASCAKEFDWQLTEFFDWPMIYNFMNEWRLDIANSKQHFNHCSGLMGMESAIKKLLSVEKCSMSSTGSTCINFKSKMTMILQLCKQHTSLKNAHANEKQLWSTLCRSFRSLPADEKHRNNINLLWYAYFPFLGVIFFIKVHVWILVNIFWLHCLKSHWGSFGWKSYVEMKKRRLVLLKDRNPVSLSHIVQEATTTLTFLGTKGPAVKGWSWTSVTSKALNGNELICEHNNYS